MSDIYLINSVIEYLRITDGSAPLSYLASAEYTTAVAYADVQAAQEAYDTIASDPVLWGEQVGACCSSYLGQLKHVGSQIPPELLCASTDLQPGGLADVHHPAVSKTGLRRGVRHCLHVRCLAAAAATSRLSCGQGPAGILHPDGVPLLQQWDCHPTVLPRRLHPSALANHGCALLPPAPVPVLMLVCPDRGILLLVIRVMCIYIYILLLLLLF